MLNDVKPPPLQYGMPDPDPKTPVPPTKPVQADAARPAYNVAPATEPGRRASVSVPYVSSGNGHVQQPPAHREVLEGHPDLPRHEPASARTPGYLRQQEVAHNGGQNHNPLVSLEMSRAGRKADVSDGGTYEYPSRWSFDSLGLSIIVILSVVLSIGYVLFRLFHG